MEGVGQASTVHLRWLTVKLLAHQLHALGGHVGGLEGVVIRIEADVHIHILRALQAVAAF